MENQEQEQVSEVDRTLDKLKKRITNLKQKSKDLSHRITKKDELLSEFQSFGPSEPSSVVIARNEIPRYHSGQAQQSQTAGHFESTRVAQDKPETIPEVQKGEAEYKFRTYEHEIEYLNTKLNNTEQEKKDIEVKYKNLIEENQNLYNKLKEIEKGKQSLETELHILSQKITKENPACWALDTTYEFISESARFFRTSRGMAQEIIDMCTDILKVDSNVQNKLNLLKEQLNKVVDTMLEAQTKYNFKGLQIKSIEINGFISNMINKFITMYKNQNVNFVYKVTAEKELSVSIDPVLFEEAMEQLVLNSVEAMPKGGNIEIGAVRNGTNIFVEIIDTGIGIPPHLVDKVIKPFFTTKQNHMGFGLTRAYWILKLHNGNIILNSTVSRGTSLKLIITE